MTDKEYDTLTEVARKAAEDGNRQFFARIDSQSSGLDSDTDAIVSARPTDGIVGTPRPPTDTGGRLVPTITVKDESAVQLLADRRHRQANIAGIYYQPVECLMWAKRAVTMIRQQPGSLYLDMSEERIAQAIMTGIGYARASQAIPVIICAQPPTFVELEASGLRGLASIDMRLAQRNEDVPELGSLSGEDMDQCDA